MSCIEPPLHLPGQQVLVDVPIVETEVSVVWNIDVDWATNWYYGWDATAAAAVLVSCSSDDFVNEQVVQEARQVPIGFNVQKKNITRSTNLELSK